MIKRIMINIWKYGRNVPWMLFAMWRWPRIACHSGLGKMRPYKPGGRDHPTSYPGTKKWRLTPAGFTFVVKHRYGQSTSTVRGGTESLKSGFRGMVRVNSVYGKPQYSRVIVLRRDPFNHVPKPVAITETKLRIGVVEDGRDYVMDLKANPHWLIMGMTNSGKSGTQSAMLAALAPTDMIIALIDLKFGVSARAYSARASVVATKQEQAVIILGDALKLGEARAALCVEHAVESVYDLPKPLQPPQVLILIDEVAELIMDTGNKKLMLEGVSNLLRNVQLLRAFGIHIIMCGQRLGSSFGDQITNIRAQLSGRILLKIQDPDTGRMAFGDISGEAVKTIMHPDTLPGVAVVNGGPDLWQRVRMSYVPHSELIKIAEQNEFKCVAWDTIMAREVYKINSGEKVLV